MVITPTSAVFTELDKVGEGINHSARSFSAVLAAPLVLEYVTDYQANAVTFVVVLGVAADMCPIACCLGWSSNRRSRSSGSWGCQCVTVPVSTHGTWCARHRCYTPECPLLCCIVCQGCTSSGRAPCFSIQGKHCRCLLVSSGNLHPGQMLYKAVATALATRGTTDSAVRKLCYIMLSPSMSSTILSAMLLFILCVKQHAQPHIHLDNARTCSCF